MISYGVRLYVYFLYFFVGLCVVLLLLLYVPLSQFQGKFVRIHFGVNGKIAGADIESCESCCYLLEFFSGFLFQLLKINYMNLNFLVYF